MDFVRSLIQDLENGKQSAYQMRTLLQKLQGSDGVDHPDHDHQYFYEGFNHHSMVVLSTFDHALSKLQTCDPFNVTTKIEYNTDDGGLTPKSSTPKNRKGCFKRRKIAKSDTVIITPNLTDDGYAWRKYGQKDIQNEKYPRNYYRCTHKFEQGCQATKQVQQMSEKPDEYRIIYRDEHTCKTLVTNNNNPLINSEDQDCSFFLNFNSPTPPKHALNPLIYTPSSSTLSPSPSPSSSSSSPYLTQECYVSIKDENQSYGPYNFNQSSDLTSYESATTDFAFDQSDVMSSSSFDVEGFYSSGVAYHGIMDNNMMPDFTAFDDVMIQDYLCV